MNIISETEVTYYRRDSYTKEFTITDKETGDAINITGYTVTMDVYIDKTPVNLAVKVFSIAGTIVNAVGGIVSFTPSSDNNDLDEKTYYYRIKLVDGAVVRTVIRDKYVII